MPAIRSLSDSPRRSRRLSRQGPKLYDYDGFEYYDQEEYYSSPFPSESTMSFDNDQSPPVFTDPLPTDPPIDEAPKPSGTSSHSRRRGPDHVPRPPNAFILYRSDYWKMEKQNDERVREKDHRQISRRAADSWKLLPSERKEEYRRQALIKKDEHGKKYPGYKYAPSHRTKPKSTKKKSGGRSASETGGRSSTTRKRGHPSSKRALIPDLSPTPGDFPRIKYEAPANPLHFSPTPTSPATLPPASLSPTPLPPTPLPPIPTLPPQPYSVVCDEYPGSCPVQDNAGPSYLEEESAFHEEFVPTDQIPEIDLYATAPQLQAPIVEAKVEVPLCSPQPSPSLPFHADMDVAFGYKPDIVQLEPHQIMLTDPSGYAEVSSFVNDASLGWGSPYDMFSGLPSLEDGLHYDYSGSMSMGQW